MKVKEFMSDNLYCISPKTSVCDCAKLMGEKHIGCLPICSDGNEILGLVTDRDIILRVVANNKDINNTWVCDIMTKDVCCCESDSEIYQAEKLMCEKQIRRIPVVENNKVIGILTLGDLAKSHTINNGGVGATFQSICKCNEKNAE